MNLHSLPGFHGTLTRRDALKLGGLALAGGLLSRARAQAPAVQEESPVLHGARARAVIQIWLWGGPAHIDTFDPKPDAGADYCGPFTSPIGTNVDGIRINELLPLLAKQAHLYTLVRSLTHGNNGHETASYIVQSGHPSSGRDVHPSMGAIVSRFRGYEAGYEGLVPPYVVLCEAQGRFSEAGFMGSRYKPFCTGGDPAAPRFLVEGVAAPGLTEARQEARRSLLKRFDPLAALLRERDPLRTAAYDNAGEAAYEMILGDAGRVFDLAREPEAMRDRYGRNTLGQSCLAARRLVERGVPFVTINAKGWDTHKQHFAAMRRKLPELDQALSTLLADLNERGLLSSTIVWVSGEFGRSPRVQTEAPWNGGRNHYGKVFSALVAGGGLRTGQIIGATDAKGEDVAERPVRPSELLATFYDRLGIPLDATLPHPEGAPVSVLPAGTRRIDELC